MRPKKKKWWVYILRCKCGTLYTGISNDVKKRVKAHNAGKGAKYTKMNGPVKLIYKREIGSMSAAMKRERKIKKAGREYKEKLVKRYKKKHLLLTSDY